MTQIIITAAGAFAIIFGLFLWKRIQESRKDVFDFEFRDKAKEELRESESIL
jgi:hypothetical protein